MTSMKRPALLGPVVLVLQGGCALGAYQVGVYQAHGGVSSDSRSRIPEAAARSVPRVRSRERM